MSFKSLSVRDLTFGFQYFKPTVVQVQKAQAHPPALFKLQRAPIFHQHKMNKNIKRSWNLQT